YWVKVPGDSSHAIALLKTRAEVAEAVAVDGQVKVTFVNHDIDPGFLPEVLVNGGVKFTGLWEDELGLEEVFLRVTRGETQ
ncbi:MAG: multidrug ABC transporter ATP-binding protein, partial [Verrucomicrobiota bacterium]